ncbi:MAG: Sensor histidine kinase WalK [Chloroflexi bacterium]|nr:Sensor histidine kinase WalK [Chloroflexota bacterium]
MATKRERILLVEPDPEISDLVARQALQPLGYQIHTSEDAAGAIRQAIQVSPDVIIANMNLSGLSGKDLLVALSSQGVETPVIIIAEEGMENEVIRTFRLGAADYLMWPFQEPEVVSAVERVLKQVRVQRERARLAEQVQKTNQELKQRVRELITLLGIGKTVTSTTDQKALFKNVVEGAMYATNADRGWLLLREEKDKEFILRAYNNLPKTIAAKLNKPWDDGISSLVAVSGETLAIHGESLGRFKVSKLGQSAIAVPINVQQETMGMLVLVREKAAPFQKNTQKLLAAVSDYAAISLVNTNLFEALEKRAYALKQTAEIAQESERVKSELLQNISHELRTPLNTVIGYISILEEEASNLRKKHRETLQEIKEKLAVLTNIIDAVTTLQDAGVSQHPTKVDLKLQIREAVGRFRGNAHKKNISLFAELPPENVYAFADSNQTGKILDALISNAIKFNKENGEVTIRLTKTKDGHPYISVQDTGIGIPKKLQGKIFDLFYQVDGSTTRQYGGLGIGLSLAKKIILSQGGKIQVESVPDKGTIVHFTLRQPPAVK